MERTYKELTMQLIACMDEVVDKEILIILYTMALRYHRQKNRNV